MSSREEFDKQTIYGMNPKGEKIEVSASTFKLYIADWWRKNNTLGEHLYVHVVQLWEAESLQTLKRVLRYADESVWCLSDESFEALGIEDSILNAFGYVLKGQMDKWTVGRFVVGDYRFELIKDFTQLNVSAVEALKAMEEGKYALYYDQTYLYKMVEGVLLYTWRFGSEPGIFMEYDIELNDFLKRKFQIVDTLPEWAKELEDEDEEAGLHVYEGKWEDCDLPLDEDNE